jgi:PAS domain S-box-containing protein
MSPIPQGAAGPDAPRVHERLHAARSVSSGQFAPQEPRPVRAGDAPSDATGRAGRRRLKVLLVEDNVGDARLIRWMLADVDPARYEIETVGRLAAALDRLALGGIDVVLLDLSLPDSQGIDTAAAVCEIAPELPVVVLTGRDDESLGLQALRLGVQDYLIKFQVPGLSLHRIIQYALERKRASAARARLATIVESSEDAIVGLSLQGRVLDWNPAAERLLGFSAEEARGRGLELLECAERPEEIRVLFEQARRAERGLTLETSCQRKDGVRIFVHLVLAGVRDRLGQVVGVTVAVRDGSERLKTEELLRRTNRLESVAQLASGVAHDFNNLLSVILGSGSLALRKLPAASPAAADIQRALAAGQRAARLTHELLAHSGVVGGEPDEAASGGPQELPASDSGSAAAAPEAPLTGTVLLIEDEELLREVAAESLAAAGLSVLSAPDGATGIDVFVHRRSEVSAVVLDLTMPGLSGEETLERLRKLDARVPVILTSGYAAPAALRRFDGATTFFLQKPSTPDALVEAVRKVLRRG